MSKKPQQVLILKGLPGSGKSTLAKQIVAEGGGIWKRINRDLMREMLDAGKFSRANEDFVTAVNHSILKGALLEGYNVIIDDTNGHPLTEKKLRDVVAELSYLNVEIEIRLLTTPLDECIARDAQRPNPVGEEVIRVH